MIGLNALLRCGLGRDELLKLAAELGSDVPFFILRSAAFCRGRGEVVTPVPLLHSFRILLLKPAFGVPTPWAYGRWKDSQVLPEVDYLPQEFKGVKLVNDLERPVFEKFVFLARLKTWLRQQPEVAGALMSGSGSTLFAIPWSPAASEVLAARARREVDPTLWSCACETVISALASPSHIRG